MTGITSCTYLRVGSGAFFQLEIVVEANLETDAGPCGLLERFFPREDPGIFGKV
jgi:hypothetical protein